MKVCFQIIAFNAMPFLEPCLEAIKDWGSIVAAEGPVRFWRERGFHESTDGTIGILGQYCSKVVYNATWREKNDMVRAAAQQIPDDVDFVFAVDSDEIWKQEDLAKIFALLESGQYDSLAFKCYSFYGGFDRYMTGFEENSPPWGWQRIQRWYRGATWATHRPPTINAPDGKPWREHNHLSHADTDKLGIRFFHYSYVLPSQMQAKAAYYHARNPHGTIPAYFERVYLPWVKGDKETKAAIETTYRGVHDWLPKGRGDCFTAEFNGKHPPEIEKRLLELRARLARELVEYAS